MSDFDPADLDSSLRLLQHGDWRIRNTAVKRLGKMPCPEAAKALLEVLGDRRPASWWRRCLGDPFFQVGFTRRNAWQALRGQEVEWEALSSCLMFGMSDPYYEVRAACWETLGYFLRKNPKHIEIPANEIQRWQSLVREEQNFEIAMGMLSAVDAFMSPDDVLALAPKVRSFKHWRVRGAYLECLGRVVKSGQLSTELVERELQGFNLRSEYFRPIFMLKEKGAELEQLLKMASQDSLEVEA